MARDIPHLDLNDFYSTDTEKRETFIKTLGDGLLAFGFLTVEGHGIDPSVTEATYRSFERFFALDEATKRKYASIRGGARGYTPFGQEHAKNNPYPDLKEFWHVGQTPPADHPLAQIYPVNIWPSEIPEMEAAVRKLYTALERCASTLLTALEEYFVLPQGTFSSMIQHGNSILRAIHYPPLPTAPPPGSVRAAAHEDINLITLLSESKGSGLELLTHEGQWLAVDALEGDIVVDSGDMLYRITNGVVPATTHRVVNPEGTKNTSRYSIPFFVHPFPDCDLSVLPHFVTDERPVQFDPITAQGFLDQRLREIGLLKD